MHRTVVQDNLAVILVYRNAVLVARGRIEVWAGDKISGIRGENEPLLRLLLIL